MRNWKKITRLYRDYLIYSFLMILSLILIFSNKNKQIETMKLELAHAVSLAKYNWIDFKSYFELRSENKRLFKENTELALKNFMYREMELENQRLRKMLHYKEKVSFNLLPAKIIGFKRHGLIHGLVLNVGVEDSVKKNMPVVIPDGLVGKIFQVGRRSCLVQLITDRNFRASGFVQRSRERGIVSWTEGEWCQLKNVLRRADVKVGDLVVTSGLGEVFPAGLPIGKITKIDQNPRSLFATIQIKLLADLNKIEEVFIIKSW